MRMIYRIILLISFIIPSHSFAETEKTEQATKELVGSWLVSVAYEGRTRLLKISEVSESSNGTHTLTAVYGWSDGSQSPIKAEFVQDPNGSKKIVFVTQADTVITASQDSKTTYIGTFAPKTGSPKGVRITKIADEQLNNKMFGFEKPDGTVPEKCAAFFGIWKGSWQQGYVEEQTLKVRKVTVVGENCIAVFTYGDTKSDPRNFSPVTMTSKDSLSFICNKSTNGTCTFTVKGDELWANYSNPGGGSNSGVFKKQQ